MIDIANAATLIFLIMGGIFFLAGTLGLMRFPDTSSRLHALSKADNIGLGFIAMGLMIQAEPWLAGLKIIMIWLIALLASAFTCFLIADRETDDGENIQVYDLLLRAALLGSAWTALFGRGPLAAVVFFIAYGLLLSLVWVQLGASDVALAEASVGAGLTGALMLGAVRLYEKDPVLHQKQLGGWRSGVVGLLACFLVGTLGWALWELRLVNVSILPLVEAHLAESGSSHPVTAVLLNFRAFDTWLELGVLLLAALSAIIVDRVNRESLPLPPPYPPHPHIAVVARTMLPLLIVIGGIMLWFGTRSPGGAFQAGALIGAAGIFLQLAGQKYFPAASSVAFRAMLTLGFGTFIVVALITFATGGRILEYPVPWAGTYILAMEIAATLSIALTLNLLYAITSKVEAPLS